MWDTETLMYFNPRISVISDQVDSDLSGGNAAFLSMELAEKLHADQEKVRIRYCLYNLGSFISHDTNFKNEIGSLVCNNNYILPVIL